MKIRRGYGSAVVALVAASIASTSAFNLQGTSFSGDADMSELCVKDLKTIRKFQFSMEHGIEPIWNRW
jgi:hypothetical protein